MSHARQNFGLLEVVLRLRDQALVQHGLELGELFLWVVTRHDHWGRDRGDHPTDAAGAGARIPRNAIAASSFEK